MRKRWAWLVFLIPAALTGAEWKADLAAAKTGAFVHAEKTYASSTSLRVTWTPPAAAVYKFIAGATGKRSTVQAEAPGDAISRESSCGTGDQAVFLPSQGTSGIRASAS